jgi:four helix bundle protein
MRAYQLAKELVDEAWIDADNLRREPVAEKVASQLYAAVGSITANLAEGYSRSSGRDRSRVFEYALGSVRESMMWYHTAQPLLGAEIVRERLNKLEQVRRLLMAMIPRERGRTIRPRNG